MLRRESCRRASSGSVGRRTVQTNCAKGVLAKSPSRPFPEECSLCQEGQLIIQIALRPFGKHIESGTHTDPLCGEASLGRGLPHVDRCGHISALGVFYYEDPFPVFRSLELQRCFLGILFACFAQELLSEIKTGQVVFV